MIVSDSDLANVTTGMYDKIIFEIVTIFCRGIEYQVNVRIEIVIDDSLESRHMRNAIGTLSEVVVRVIRCCIGCSNFNFCVRTNKMSIDSIEGQGIQHMMFAIDL